MADPQIGPAAPGTALPPNTLGPEAYQALYGMSMSDDAATRAKASELSKKLTPAEQRQFVDFQKAQHPTGEIGRVDNSVLGMPPEAAVVAGLGIARAAAAPAVSAGARIVAGAKAAAGQAAPAIKYEATKTLLEKMGVPTPLAVAAGMAVSGYRRSGGAAAAETPPPVPSEAPPMSADALATARAANPAPYEEAIAAAKRATGSQSGTATSPVATPDAALSRPPASAPAATGPAMPDGQILATLQRDGGLSAAEANQALKWIRQGTPLETIQQRILDARQLQASPTFANLQTPDQAEAAAAARAAESRARSAARKATKPPTAD